MYIFRCEIADAHVWSFMIVKLHCTVEMLAGLGQVCCLVVEQVFILEDAVDSFCDCVFDWIAALGHADGNLVIL